MKQTIMLAGQEGPAERKAGERRRPGERQSPPRMRAKSIGPRTCTLILFKAQLHSTADEAACPAQGPSQAARSRSTGVEPRCGFDTFQRTETVCGIAGVWGGCDEALIRRMTERVAHRGPDDSGVGMWPDEPVPVSLGHRRLSIIDLSAAGHQPMANEDGSVWTVFNGEIYNFPALRAELLAAGHAFRSETDTEVLVHGYEEWGLDLVGRLNGIFAFALWDRRRSQLHLVRDRYGVKPLYYARAGEQVLFASEIKSLLCSPDVSRGLRPEALLAYLQFRYCPE